MPKRSYSSAAGYRYGFNGKENDNDVKGLGNQQDYGMRIYDPRLGKFLSVDPITNDYPWLTPYQFSSNNPISFVDVDGLEGWYSLRPWLKKNAPILSGTLEGTGEFLIETKNFITRDAFKGSTWKNMGKSFIAMGALNNPSSAIAFDQQFGTDIFQRQLAIYQTVNEIPNWSSYDWSKNITKLALGIIGTKGAGVVIREAGIALKELSIVSASSKLDFRVRLTSADEINKGFTSKGYEAPYQAGATIGEFETQVNMNNLVRISGPNNVQGSWLTTMDEIKGLTPAQIKDKLSLPYEPSRVTSVTVQQGATVRVGTAASVKAFNTQGGGFQMEVLNGNIQYGKTELLKQ